MNESRRAFLGGLVLGPASITASQSVTVVDTQQGALSLDQPYCPNCGNVQMIPNRYHFETGEAWARYVTTRQLIECNGCREPLYVTFGRRM